MMEGITILNQEEFISLPEWFGPAIFGCFALAFVLIMVGSIIKNIICYIIAALALGSIFVAGGIAGNETSKHYEYECLIDEAVDFVDIHKLYDVIEQRGDIWILREKEIGE